MEKGERGSVLLKERREEREKERERERGHTNKSECVEGSLVMSWDSGLV